VNALIAVQPNDRVLEIGCGTGKLIKIMAKKIDKGIISGIDFSSTMVTSNVTDIMEIFPSNNTVGVIKKINDNIIHSHNPGDNLIGLVLPESLSIRYNSQFTSWI